MKAMFPGSFDPITNGHLDVIARGSRMFDELVVAIMTNSSKYALFSTEEKMMMVTDAVRPYSNVKVVAMADELTVKTAAKLGINVILRGVRNVDDFQFEQQIATMNRELDSRIETFLLPTSPEVASISSSIVKEIGRFHGDTAKFLPAKAQAMLEVKFNEKEK